MKRNSLQSRVTTGKGTLPAVILVCALCWVAVYLAEPFFLSGTLLPSGVPPWLYRRAPQLPLWAHRLGSYAVCMAVGYFLVELNNRFAIIRMRASVQTAVYFLFVTVCPVLHRLDAGCVASLPFVVSLYLLFDSYQNPHAGGRLFGSFACLGIGSLLLPQLTFLVVPWLWGAYWFRSLPLRRFCASRLGWWFPYWFLLAYAFLCGEMELFCLPFRDLATFCTPFDFSWLQPWQWATLGYLLLLYAVASAHCIASGFEDKIRTRAYLQFLIRATGFLFVWLCVQPASCNDLLPLLMVTVGILAGHFFILTRSKASNRFFVLSVALLGLLFAFNLWTLL